MPNDSEGLEKVHEIKCGSVVLEIFKRTDPSGRAFYDYRESRQFTKRDATVHKTPYLQQRDFRDSMRAILDAMEWISQKQRADF